VKDVMARRNSQLAAVLPTALISILATLLVACGDDGKAATGPKGTPITAATARSQLIDVTEKSVGRLDAVSAPAIASEVQGRILRMAVDAGTVVKTGQLVAEIDPELSSLAVASARASVDGLQARLANQERTVQRYQELKSQAISQSSLEEAVATRDSLDADLREARAKLADSEFRLAHTQVRSPLDATIERRRVSVGDYVNVGAPLFDVVNARQMRAILPFPERLAFVLKPGLKIRLSSPVRPAERLEVIVSEVRPMVGAENRALEALASLAPSADWPPGASVDAELVLESRQAVVVPTQSLVLRPAGELVYVVENDMVRAQPVTVGVRTPEWTEIRSGLEAGSKVAVDGAGFLTDGAPIKLVAGS